MRKYKNQDVILDSIADNHLNTEDDSFSELYDARKNRVYFAFVDVLGFSNEFELAKMTVNAVASKLAIEKYAEVFGLFFRLLNAYKPDERSGEWYAGQTSDSLFFYSENIAHLKAFIVIYQFFSLYAMNRKVFFRGGIAKGDLCYQSMHQHRFYGECVINAYRLESQIAKNPAIFLEENVYNDLLSAFVGVDCLGEFNKSKRHYIKPFSDLFRMVHEYVDKAEFEDMVEIVPFDIMPIIEEQKRIHEFDSKNYDKFVFLENELNGYLREKETSYE